MLGYYLDLAWRSFRRTPVLTALMVLAISVGIGASMTMLTVLHVLSGDPLPGLSAHLYRPQIDPRGLTDYVPGKSSPLQFMDWTDGMNLLHAKRAVRQALMTGGTVAVQPPESTLDAFYEPARYTTSEFFPMFGVPFKFGRAWGLSADKDGARVAVISDRLNRKLFGCKDSVGRSLQLDGTTFQVIGVLGHWNPNPHFYDLSVQTFGHAEGVYVPLSTSQALRMDHSGGFECWGHGGGSSQHPGHNWPCAWLELWVQLDTPTQVAAYHRFLVNYSAQQHALGRFQRAPDVRLRDLMQWLNYNGVVPDDVRVQTWLAFGFLIVCLVNTMGLMLAKFMRRQGELGVRRALGASRLAVFEQLLVESGLAGVAGGIGGVLLALVGLWLVRHRPSSYAALAHTDPAMLLATFVLALIATLIAALIPAWHACRVAPASQLKLQ